MKTAVRKGGRFFMIRGRCRVFIELRIFPVLNSKDVTGEADRRNAAYYDYKGMNNFFEEWTG